MHDTVHDVGPAEAKASLVTHQERLGQRRHRVPTQWPSVKEVFLATIELIVMGQA